MNNNKVIEITSASKKGWNDATELAINKAYEMWPDTKTFSIKQYNAIVRENRIVEYRITVLLGYLK